MKIIVDGEPTDQFGRPDEDETLGNFIESVNEELSQTNRVLSDIRIDGEAIRDENYEVKCQEIDELEVEVSTFEDLTISSIGELGSYAHRFLDRMPEIVDEWEDLTRDQIETYRNQVLEALNATSEVLGSVEKLTNVETGDTDRKTMMERASDLRAELSKADVDDIRSILEESAREYFENLIETLQSILDKFEQRRDDLVEKAENIQNVLTDLREDVADVVKKAQEQSQDVSEWLNLERIRSMAEELTRVNTILNELDQAGKLRAYFPPERHEQIETTLKELRESIGRLFALLEDRDPTQVVKVLKKEIEPYLDDAVRLFEELAPEEPEEGAAESSEAEEIDV